MIHMGVRTSHPHILLVFPLQNCTLKMTLLLTREGYKKKQLLKLSLQ